MQSEDKADKQAEDEQAGDAAETPEAAAGTDGKHGEHVTEGRVDASEDEDTAAASEAECFDLEAELIETKDRLLRALAEAENVRRRASRDVENASKRAIAGFAREMVVVADNLSRALGAVDKDKLGDNDAVKSLLEGIEMTAREMQNAFARNGIKKIDPLGERFDPQHHEAMFEYEDPSKPAGSIGQVMELGYTLHDQPLRPAKVGVTKGGAKQGPAPTPSPQTLDEAGGDNSSGSGGASSGTAYEDDKKPSGTNIDEEL